MSAVTKVRTLLVHSAHERFRRWDEILQTGSRSIGATPDGRGYLVLSGLWRDCTYTHTHTHTHTQNCWLKTKAENTDPKKQTRWVFWTSTIIITSLLPSGVAEITTRIHRLPGLFALQTFKHGLFLDLLETQRGTSTIRNFWSSSQTHGDFTNIGRLQAAS